MDDNNVKSIPIYSEAIMYIIHARSVIDVMKSIYWQIIVICSK